MKRTKSVLLLVVLLGMLLLTVPALAQETSESVPVSTLQSVLAWGAVIVAIFAGVVLFLARELAKSGHAGAQALLKAKDDLFNSIPLHAVGQFVNAGIEAYERRAQATKDNPLDDLMAKAARLGYKVVFDEETKPISSVTLLDDLPAGSTIEFEEKRE